VSKTSSSLRLPTRKTATNLLSSSMVKTSGWKLLDDRKHITFIDKCGISQLKLIGT
jgi:hypothetical protein